MIELKHFAPADIERESMKIIKNELETLGKKIDPVNEKIILRAIHTTADFDYADSLFFTDGAADRAILALRNGADIVTDTNMAKAGVSKNALKKAGGDVFCYMADCDVAARARQEKTTRAVAAMKKAASENSGAVLAVGNAPTALFEICDLIGKGLRPALVIGVPVGFVNVVESKERLKETCLRYDIPAVIAMGRKGGSSVAAAICNALLYDAANMSDPEKR